MQTVSLLRERVQRVKGVFLAKGGIILQTDTGPGKGATFPSWPIEYLLEIIREKKGNVSSIYINGNDRFFIFVNGAYVLGVLTLPDVNTPLLRMVARKTLEDVRIKEDQAEIAGISERKLPEDQIVVSRMSAADLSELPETVRSLLELVDGKRTLHEIVRLSDLPLEQVVEFVHNYRRTGNLLGIEKGFDKEAVCERLRLKGL